MKTGMLRLRRGVRAFCHGLALALLAMLPSLSPADSKCKLGQVAEFPIRIEEGRAIVTAGINGADAQFTLDSGAFYSMLTDAAASQFNLQTRMAPFGFYVTGAHRGTADVSIATVKTFTLAGVPVKNVDFLVGGSDPRAGTVGLMGQNVLHIADDEYDFKQGIVRLMKPIDCAKTMLAYWAATTKQPYSVIPIDQGTRPNWHTYGSAYINGLEIHVMFDSGAPTSILSTRTAARAGITPDSPGTIPGGMSGGLGQVRYPTYIALFSSFKIGDEEIKNAKLRMGDIELQNADMLLGLDFFLSHHIYVANSQGKMYFTYEGGPVFDLKTRRAPADGSSTAAAAPAAAPAGTPAAPTAAGDAAPPAGGTAEEAADWSRQGAAAATRGQLDVALTDFNHACAIEPDNPDYLYQRGMVLWRNKQSDLAQADFEHAIRVAPTHVPVRIAHAELLLSRGDRVGGGADLDAADAAAPKEADIRFTMAELYERADSLDPSLEQFDLWIQFHGVDVRMPLALNGRCWIRALQDTQLPQALKDCNAARSRVEKSDPILARILDSRALVYLRMGENQKSMTDYDASLKMGPKNPWAWYGRGIAELRLGKAAAGQADMEQAKTIWPKVAEAFTRYGIGP